MLPVHWDTTGQTAMEPHWLILSPSGLPMATQSLFIICIIETYWKTTGDTEVHWDATATTLADASTQWCPSGNKVVISIIGTHWNTTGGSLETLQLPKNYSPVASQCTLGSKFQAHWISTGLPLNNHWLKVGDSNLTFMSFLTFPTRIFYRGVPGFPIDCRCGDQCHWLTTSALYVGSHFGNLV